MPWTPWDEATPGAPVSGPGLLRDRCTLCGARTRAGDLAACGACPAAFCPGCAADFALPAHRRVLPFPDGREVPLRADRCPSDGALLAPPAPGSVLFQLVQADRRLGEFLAARGDGLKAPGSVARRDPARPAPLTGFAEGRWRAVELAAWARLSGMRPAAARAVIGLLRRVLAGGDPARWLGRLRTLCPGVSPDAEAVGGGVLCLLRLCEGAPCSSPHGNPWRGAAGLAAAALRWRG